MKKLIFLLALAFAFGCNQSNKVENCIDPSKIDPDAVCTMQYEPVCGCDNKTYGNACEAEKAGITSWTEGECTSGNTSLSD